MVWNRLTQVLCVASAADKRRNYKNAIIQWMDCVSPRCFHTSSDTILGVHEMCIAGLKGSLTYYSITQLIWLLTAESVPITITCMRTYIQSYISFMRTVNREELCQFFSLVTAIKIGAQWEASDDKLSRFHSRWHDKVNRLHILLQMHSIWADAY